MKFLFLLIGLGCGVITAGGVFGLLTQLRLLTRFAEFSNTKKYLFHYEGAILWGATIGNIIYLFPVSIYIPFINILSVIIVIFAGIFVGCLGMALAEALNVTAVFSRRMHLHSHIGIIVLAIALGKMVGSLLYFQIEM